ncbi:uncharacterized protein LOC141832476 [Curcuma longa]|uniref:uncharacterized protein LOC141832476 n=1 Tax=Curcuma longa TaxID=136217 RepID=UPI003D9DFC6A
MDKSWILKPRDTPEYIDGLLKFLDFAFANASSDNRIKCPCSRCGFRLFQTREEVYDHLLLRPFPPGYTVWLLHGERGEGETSSYVHETQHTKSSEDPIRDMIQDAFIFPIPNVSQDSTMHDPLNEGEGRMPHLQEGPSGKAKEFYDLLKDGEQELYKGCSKYSKLSFLVKLYHIKCICGMSDKALSMIIELLHDAFEHAKIPESLYEAKKTIKKLGLNYKKIDACPNDCMLYWGPDKSLNQCKRCGTSRWKNSSIEHRLAITKRKKQPAKFLRYFPLIPRLQRLFMSSKTSDDMKWHAVDSNKDGLLRHPRDAEAWKRFDSKFFEFSSDARNVRLALASDGFNPFGNMSTNYSIWPVILIPYNTPPWTCMKQTNFILSMIIPGKKMPGNDIDIYLQPLIDELKVLWDGVETFDASSNENFKMRAALMWTISDFPGLGTLSGWNTYGKLACPICNIDTEPCRLHHSRKWCFMGHRRFLHAGHRFRLDKTRFDGKIDRRNPPVKLSGSAIFSQVENIQVSFGKTPEVKGKRGRGQRNANEDESHWRKRSIFFELPYWEFNALRHNLDVMHIEKNVCDNVLYTLLNESGKTKDHLNARRDLQSMGIRSTLWPNENGKYPSAIFTMSNKQKDIFLKTLKNVVVPDGYSSNISRCIDVKQRKIFGLKSHDCHILMEQLLPIALRNAMPGLVFAVIADLCSFFRQICSKVLNPIDLVTLQDQIVHTLCHLEMIFPPSFFTVMVHLIVHLVDEVKEGGPVHYRWMYPIERYLGRLKSYVRNKAQPEGSIVQGYLAEEILTFCSRYLNDTETRTNRPRRVDDQPDHVEHHESNTMFPKIGRSVGGFSYFILTPLEKLQAHRHVLVNCIAVDPFLE